MLDAAEAFDPFVGVETRPVATPVFQPRRDPGIGGILPSLADRIINDARGGYDLEGICLRQRVDAEVVIAMIERGLRNDLLRSHEAARFGVKA